MKSTLLTQYRKVIQNADAVNLWNEAAAFMNLAHNPPKYKQITIMERMPLVGLTLQNFKNDCFFQISCILESFFARFGTQNIRYLILRNPDRKIYKIECHDPTSPKYKGDSLGKTCQHLYMDLRFGDKQFIAFKYKYHESILTTIPLYRITCFFPDMNPYLDSFPNMDLNEIKTQFNQIESALDLTKKNLFG